MKLVPFDFLKKPLWLMVSTLYWASQEKCSGLLCLGWRLLEAPFCIKAALLCHLKFYSHWNHLVLYAIHTVIIWRCTVGARNHMATSNSSFKRKSNKKLPFGICRSSCGPNCPRVHWIWIGTCRIHIQFLAVYDVAKVVLLMQIHVIFSCFDTC